MRSREFDAAGAVRTSFGPGARDAAAKRIALIAALALFGGLAACSSLERSRDLADPRVSGQTLALQVCSNCHGVDGHSVSPNFPNLAGQTEEYFVGQLKGFKSHNRADPAGFEYMWGISKHLTDDQIKGLAAYYAKQRPRPNEAGDPKLAAAGRDIFTKGVEDKEVPACTSCHGEAGQGNGQFPRIADQHGDYLVKQLNVFQRTDERPEGSIMKTVAHGLTPDHMAAVAAYLQSLPVTAP